jgi:hypothetical protein
MKRTYKGTSPLVNLLRTIGNADMFDLKCVKDVTQGEQSLKNLSTTMEDSSWQKLANPFFDLLGANGHIEVRDSYDKLQGELRYLKQQIARIEKAAKSTVMFNERRTD